MYYEIEDGQAPEPGSGFALKTAQGTYCSPTLTGLIGALIPGYEQMDDDDAMEARIIFACHAADLLQAQEAARVDLDPAAETEETLTALATPRCEGPLFLHGAWQHDARLILVQTDYAPFSRYPAPAGHVAFIDPCDERSFLDSLSALGAMTLHVRED